MARTVRINFAPTRLERTGAPGTVVLSGRASKLKSDVELTLKLGSGTTSCDSPSDAPALIVILGSARVTVAAVSGTRSPGGSFFSGLGFLLLGDPLLVS